MPEGIDRKYDRQKPAEAPPYARRLDERVAAGVLMEFGELMRRLRENAGLTQLELATAIDVSERTVRTWETEKPPPASKAHRVAELLGLTGAEYARFLALASGRDAGEAPTAIAAATRTLPRDIASFTRREPELDALAAAVASAPQAGGVPQICVIHGMPGVGKTKLAVHFAHTVADRYPDGQFFADLYGHSAQRRPVDPEDELSALLLAAGIPRPVIPDGVNERAATWRDWTAGRRALLLLDDARDAAQVIPLLPGSAGNLVLITTRQRFVEFPDATDVPVEIMEPGDAAELFTRLASRPGLLPGSREVAEVIGLLGGLPIVIAPMAGQLKRHPTWRVSDLGARLGRSGGRLGLPASERATVPERATVADAFDLSYRALSADLQRMFRRLALHPGPDIDPYSAAALDNRDPDSAGVLLEELFGYHLIDEQSPERYLFHDLIRDYALTRVAADPPGEVAAAERRLLAYYFRSARAADQYLYRRTPTGMPKEEGEGRDVSHVHSRPDAFAWMDDNYRHLHAAAEYAYARGHRQYANLIPAYLDEYLTRRGRWSQLRDLHQLAVRAAGDADLAGKARALSDLGGVQYMLGDLDSASRNLDEALALYGGLADPLGRAQVFKRQGSIAFLAGRYEDADRVWSSALKLFRQVSDRRGEADALVRIGLLQYETGQIAAALASQSAARDMCVELDDPLGLANALCYLGEVQRDLGLHDEAIAATTRSIALYRELGDSFTIAGARSYLGASLRAAGRLDEAREEFSAALAVYQEAGDDFDGAGVLNQIGMLQTQERDFAGAADSLARALEQYKRWGSENGKCEVLNSLGEMALAAGDLDEALQYFRQALAIAEEKEILREEARARSGTGLAYRVKGRAAAADGELRVAYAIYAKLESPAAARLAELISSDDTF
jgi:tetratricopeptide (TPR) repeat protein/transcriptional regulator with XRE-family HTH domain